MTRQASPYDSFFRTVRLTQLWRPIVIFTHILIVSLVMLATNDDRMWNLQQKGLAPFPPLKTLTNCSQLLEKPVPGTQMNGCCVSEAFNELDGVYKNLQGKPRNLMYINCLLYLCAATVMLSVGCSMLELAFMRKLDSSDGAHQLVNVVGTIAYMMAIYLLAKSVKVVELERKSPFNNVMCRVYTNYLDESIPVEKKLLGMCFTKAGLCRNEDSLMLALICVVVFPFLCVFVYFCSGLLTLLCPDPDKKDKKRRNSLALPEQGPYRLRQLPGALGKLAQQLAYPTTSGGNIVPVHSTGNSASTSTTRINLEQAAKSRGALFTLLQVLDEEPQCRQNELFLSALGKTFKDYVKAGYTPKLTVPTTNPNYYYNYNNLVGSRLRPAGAGVGISSGRRDNVDLNNNEKQESLPSYEQALINQDDPRMNAV